MVLSDFLSRQSNDDSNQQKIIPISFNMHNLLHEEYYNIGKTGIYLVQMRFQTRSSDIKLSEVHGVSKNLNPNIQPEKQNIRPLKGNEILEEKHCIGQGRVGMKGRRPPPFYQTSTLTSELSKRIPEVSIIEMGITNQADFTTPAQSISNSNVEVTHRRPMIKTFHSIQIQLTNPHPN